MVFDKPGQLSLKTVALRPPQDGEVVVDIVRSGISTGTERLLWSGEMPPFPGLAYPLVPGYESVGHVVAGDSERFPVGTRVFVPGSQGFVGVHGLFGGAAARVVTSAARITAIDGLSDNDGVLLALAATAYHAFEVAKRPARAADPMLPDLIVGHGVLGRLLARLSVVAGAEPTVWESRAERRSETVGYRVVDAADDERRDYRCVVDVSGDIRALDAVVERSDSGAHIVLAGFYADRVSFDFPPAFMKELRFSIAAEWKPADLMAVKTRVAEGALSLDALVSHTRPAHAAADAYASAFNDVECLKMVLDWEGDV